MNATLPQEASGTAVTHTNQALSLGIRRSE